jgi:hypothetical protein
MWALIGLWAWEFYSDVDALIRKTLSVLRDLAFDFAPQPGRKSLVWVTHGVPIEAVGPDRLRRDYTPLVLQLGTDLARSGITVYAVDQAHRDTPGLNSSDTLQQLAGLTGGKWLPSDATEIAIQQAVTEGRATYQVGYSPPPGRWNNKFHRVRITAAAKGGARLRIRAINGYYGDQREADPLERLSLAVLGQSDAPGIGIWATAEPSEKLKGWFHFQIRVDPSDLHITSNAISVGRYRLAFA